MSLHTDTVLIGAAMLASFTALGCTCWAVRERARTSHLKRLARHGAALQVRVQLTVRCGPACRADPRRDPASGPPIGPTSVRGSGAHRAGRRSASFRLGHIIRGPRHDGTPL